MNRNRRNALIAGSLLLLAANLAALGGVAWNRSGEAESKLVLSQRELQRNWSYGFWSGPAQGRNAVQPDGSRSPPTEA